MFHSRAEKSAYSFVLWPNENIPNIHLEFADSFPTFFHEISPK